MLLIICPQFFFSLFGTHVYCIINKLHSMQSDMQSVSIEQITNCFKNNARIHPIFGLFISDVIFGLK